MFNNERINIAVLICDCNSYFQEQLCTTISNYGKKLGYNLCFFTCFTTYGRSNKNATGEFNILNLPPYELYDGIIVCADTFGGEEQVERIREYLNSRSRGPVVCIRHQIDDYPCVLVDDSQSIKAMVQHFVQVHHFTRIGFMTGLKNHPDSIARHNAYKMELQNQGIAYDESLVFEGDFWRNRSKAAAHYFAEELETPPEAIICANDYMAISLSTELILSGHMVPDDIAISGFDDIAESTVTMPPLTTVTVSCEDLGRQALHMLRDLLADKDIPTVQYISTQLAIRNSCGCKTFDMRSMITTRVQQESEHHHLINQTINNTFTSIALQGLLSTDSIGQYLHLPDYEDNGIQDFHLCLGEGRGPIYPKYRSNRPNFPKKSHSVYSLINREEVITSTFNTTDLIPVEAMSEEPMCYFFYPLHYLDFTLGYIAIQYINGYTCEKTFQSWLAIISTSLENLRVSNERTHLLNELNTLYIHDALTGIYNRRGFEKLASEMFDKAKKQKKSTMILCMDMDNLKKVNDQYGHRHGDLSLRAISEALQHAATNHEICARVGGDEFSVIGMDYTEEKAEQFIQAFQEYLDETNENSIYNYTVSTSYGYTITDNTSGYTLEEYVNLSDSRLYEHKRNKKSKSN